MTEWRADIRPTELTEVQIGSQMYACTDCRLYDPDTYVGPEITYWTLRNGNSITLGGMTLPLSSQFIPCEIHAAVLALKYPA